MVTVPELSFEAIGLISRQRGRFPPLISEEYGKTMFSEYSTFRKVIPDNIKNIIDIGPGIGGYHIFLNEQTGNSANFHFLDKNHVAPVMRYGYLDDTDGYSIFSETERYLAAGGIDPARMHFWNASEPREVKNLAAWTGHFDVVMSIFSWCFHYPATLYLDLAATILADDGVMIADVRKGEDQEKVLETRFESLDMLFEDALRRRFVFRKRRAPLSNRS